MKLSKLSMFVRFAIMSKEFAATKHEYANTQQREIARLIDESWRGLPSWMTGKK